MAETTHTPGPWEVKRTNEDPFETGSADRQRRTTSATVYAGKNPDHEGRYAVVGVGDLPEDAANARLIAAAPDLLECLRRVVSVCDRNDDGSLSIGLNGFGFVESAIAKATN